MSLFYSFHSFLNHIMWVEMLNESVVCYCNSRSHILSLSLFFTQSCCLWWFAITTQFWYIEIGSKSEALN